MFRALMRLMHGPIYRARIGELVRQIVPYLRQGDQVLDVGCGFGTLGRAILDSPQCPPGVTVQGLERVKRGDELIPVQEYTGRTVPFPPRSFDVVVLADVLHHDPDPSRVIAQCAQLSRRLLIIKDHKVDGFLAPQRISLIDWAANAPHGVPCLYRYLSADEWAQSHRKHGLHIEREIQSMNLYPLGFNLLFGRRLQYFAVLGVDDAHSK
jgi:SAM-dependent methyltransferase